MTRDAEILAGAPLGDNMPILLSIVRHLLTLAAGGLLTIGVSESEAHTLVTAAEPVVAGAVFAAVTTLFVSAVVTDVICVVPLASNVRGSLSVLKQAETYDLIIRFSF